MLKSLKVIACGLAAVVLLGCSNSEDASATQSEAESTITTPLPKPDFVETDWVELIPIEDLKALMTPPASLSLIQDGSEEDQLSAEFPDISAPPSDDPYQQALVSTRIKPELDGKLIRLPGFIVPLEFDDNLVITQFFLVPFFGACLHVPPPPPNQIIAASYPKGMTQETLDEAFWVYGVLNTTLTQNDIATSAYSMTVHHIEPYSEE